MTCLGAEQAQPTILDVMSDPALFGPTFQGDSWRPWRAFLATVFGLPLSEAERALVRDCTGREAVPTAQAREVWTIVGRRGGKSRISALLAVYVAAFRDYGHVLALGERGTLMLLAADRRQARVLFRYVKGFLESAPMLAAMVERETLDQIDLTNNISIEVHAASFRGVRGYTTIGVICDEIAFWPTDDAADPDTEIVNALRPSMASVPGALLIAISTPYARRGELWRAYKKNWGQEGEVLVWRAATRSMNATVPQSVLDRAYEADPASAAAEYGGEFRTAVESFVSREAVEACVVPDRRELPPVSGTTYRAFTDPSGGSADSMTIAVGHTQDDVGVVDLVREVTPPFSPEQVVAEFVETLKAYRVHRVTGDRYGGEWPREQFRKLGVEYALSDDPKSLLYGALLPVLNSGRLELLDHPRLISQLLSLERRTSRGGKDSIDHPPGRGTTSHDDVINSVAGLVSLLAARQPRAATGMPYGVPRISPWGDP